MYQRVTVKGLLSRIYITELSVEKDLYPKPTQRDTWRVLIDIINIMCGSRIVKTSKVWKGKSKIVKGKGTNNFKLKV